MDLTDALKDHYNPELVKQKLAECHEWLKKDSKFTDDERTIKGWNRAYNLTTWGEFPGKNEPFKGLSNRHVQPYHYHLLTRNR